MDLQIKTFRIHNEADEAAFNAFLQNKIIRHWSSSYLPDTTGALGAISSALTGSQSDPMSSSGSWNVFVAYEIRMNNEPRTNQRSGSNDRMGNGMGGDRLGGDRMTNANGAKRGQDARGGGASMAGTNQRQPAKPKEPRAPKEDYVPNVAESDMPLFEAVRKWRNARARDERVKPFAFFNNRQLEEVVKAKPTTESELRTLLPDMEQPLFDRYHNELLGFLGAMHNPESMSAMAGESTSEAASA